MADIQVDIGKLKNFSDTISLLVAELDPASFIPSTLVKDPKRHYPDIGQNVNEQFKDGTDLYAHYDLARSQIIGNGQNVPGSFADFLNELQVLSNVATQIYQNYQQANSEDQYSADMVDKALNSPLPQQPAGQ